MFRQNQSASSSIEANNFNRSGVELLDDLRGLIASERILGDMASPDGLAMSLLHGTGSPEVDAIGHFQPGVDAPSSIDYRATYASDRPQAKKTLSLGAPSRLHVVLDAPRRTELLEGKMSFEYIGNFVLAVTAVVGEAIGDAELRVYHTAAQSQDGVVFEGAPEDAYATFGYLEELQKRSADKPSSTLTDLLSSVNATIDQDNEASVIVSDFMDGYDVETNTFEWEQDFAQLAQKQEDLLWVNQVMSASHDRLPYGLIKGLDSLTIASINSSYAEQAQLKQDRAAYLLGSSTAKLAKIDTNSTDIERIIIKSILPDTVE